MRRGVTGWGGMGEDRLLWAGVGQGTMGHYRMGRYVMGWCGTGLSQPRLVSPLLSHSPGHDPHHSAARVAGGDGGDTGVPDLLRSRPARACVPVVLWEAAGEVLLGHIEHGPQAPSIRAPRWVGGSPQLLSPPCFVGAWSHKLRAGARRGHPARPARVVHLPGELRGRLRLLQVGPGPGGDKQQPRLRWGPRSVSPGCPHEAPRAPWAPGWLRGAVLTPLLGDSSCGASLAALRPG